MFRRCTLFLAAVPRLRFGLVSAGVVLLGAAAAPATTYRVTDLGTLGTGTTSYGLAVNDSGQVAGAANTTTAGKSTVAAIYTGGAWTNIGTAFNSSQRSYATAINDSGVAAGWTYGTSDDSFIYNAGTYTNIGTVPGVCNGQGNMCGQDTAQTGFYTQAAPINSSGQIVGEYGNTAGGTNLYVYGGSTSVVTTPGTNVDTSITGASGINNSGCRGELRAGHEPHPHRLLFQRHGARHMQHDISGGDRRQHRGRHNYDYHSDTGTVT